LTSFNKFDDDIVVVELEDEDFAWFDRTDFEGKVSRSLGIVDTFLELMDTMKLKRYSY